MPDSRASWELEADACTRVGGKKARNIGTRTVRNEYPLARLGNGLKKEQKKRVNGRRGRRGTGRRICRPRTYHPAGFGGSWAFLVPGSKPNRGFEVRNPAGALRTPTPTVLSTHLVQGRSAHTGAQAKNALTSIPPTPLLPTQPPTTPSLAYRRLLSF